MWCAGVGGGGDTCGEAWEAAVETGILGQESVPNPSSLVGFAKGEGEGESREVPWVVWGVEFGGGWVGRVGTEEVVVVAMDQGKGVAG